MGDCLATYHLFHALATKDTKKCTFVVFCVGKGPVLCVPLLEETWNIAVDTICLYVFSYIADAATEPHLLLSKRQLSQSGAPV